MSNIIQNIATLIEVVISGDTTSVPTGIANYVDDEKVFSWAGTINMDQSKQDNPLFLLENPIGSGKKFVLENVYGGVAISNNWTLIKMFANPTVTANGTALTAINNKIGGTVTSVANIYSLPTTSSNGVELRSKFNGENNNSIRFVDQEIIILEGQTFLISGEPKSNDRDLSLTVTWIEI